LNPDISVDMYPQRFVAWIPNPKDNTCSSLQMKGPFMGCLSCSPCVDLLLSLEGFESAVYSLSYCRNNIIS